MIQMPKIEVELSEELFLFVETAAKVNKIDTTEFLSILLDNFLKGFLKGLTVTAEQMKTLPYGM